MGTQRETDRQEMPGTPLLPPPALELQVSFTQMKPRAGVGPISTPLTAVCGHNQKTKTSMKEEQAPFLLFYLGQKLAALGYVMV